MKKYIIFISFLFSIIQSFSQVIQFGENIKKEKNNYTFGVRIIPSAYGVCQFFVIKRKTDNSIERYSFITRKMFIKQAMGKQLSDANPYKENLFIKNKVFDSAKIMRHIISTISSVPSDPKIYEYKKQTKFNDEVQWLANIDLGNLWKLRYAVYPFYTRGDTLGWTKNFKNPYMPKAAQMKILKQYGVKTINGFIYGEDFFKLLKDMFTKEWVMNYTNASEEKPKDNQK